MNGVALRLDYYMIDGQRHDAYLYIHYINNAGPQTGWLTVLARYQSMRLCVS